MLTAGDVVHSADGEAARGSVNADVTIESLLPSLLIDPRPMEVVDGSGVSLGIVDRDAVAQVLD